MSGKRRDARGVFGGEGGTGLRPRTADKAFQSLLFLSIREAKNLFDVIAQLQRAEGVRFEVSLKS